MPNAKHPSLGDLARVPGPESVPRDPSEPEYWRQFLHDADDTEVEFLVPGDLSGPFERFGALAEHVRANWRALKPVALRFLVKEDLRILKQIADPHWELLGITLLDDETARFEMDFHILEDGYTTWSVTFAADEPIGWAFW